MRSLTLFILFIIAVFFYSCESCKECDGPEFSGKVISNSGSAIAGATVKINDKEATTDNDGVFKMSICDKSKSDEFLVTVRKFGFGLYAKRFNSGFKEKEIVLAQGTVVDFDPSVATTLTDTVSTKNPYKPGLLSLDTAKLFRAVPKVYDASGKLIDIGYPNEVKGIFDFLKQPLGGGPGISVAIPANSFVDNSNNPPPAGAMLQASLSTVDFFNPDGMPGDFRVQTREGMAYMESFGAGTIEISDGKQSYQIRKGTKVQVTFPVYPIRLQLKESLPESMPLLHYFEDEGVWKETGKGILNAEKNAYIADVDHFTVLNMDIIKTGPSKCFKVRQMLKFGASDNTSNYLSTYKAQIIVPATATTNFMEWDYLVQETTGCVPVAVGANNTRLHPVTRIPNTYIAVVFSRDGVADTLDIVIAQPATTSIPAQTAVMTAGDCSTATCTPATDCVTPDPLDANASPQSICNTSCWMADCGFIPFANLGAETRVIGIAMGAGKVKVKWVNTITTGSLRVTAYATGNCSGASTVLFSRCVLNTGCGPGECLSGEVVHSAPAGSTISFKIEAFDTTISDCGGIPIGEDCSEPVVVL
jgi:archaellum component FlaF (FlaF/FlaG flagellin family)